MVTIFLCFVCCRHEFFLLFFLTCFLTPYVPRTMYPTCLPDACRPRSPITLSSCTFFICNWCRRRRRSRREVVVAAAHKKVDTRVRDSCDARVGQLVGWLAGCALATTHSGSPQISQIELLSMSLCKFVSITVTLFFFLSIFDLATVTQQDANCCGVFPRLLKVAE